MNVGLKMTDLKRYSIKAATEVRKRKHLRGGKRLVLRSCLSLIQSSLRPLCLDTETGAAEPSNGYSRGEKNMERNEAERKVTRDNWHQLFVYILT